METLDRLDKEKQEWKAVLVEDKHVGPAEIAAPRIDFAARLRPRRDVWPTVDTDATSARERDTGERRDAGAAMGSTCRIAAKRLTSRRRGHRPQRP